MNIARSSLLAVPVLAVAAAFAWVQPAASQDAAPEHGGPEHGAPEHGGSVTMAQFVARQSARLMALDTDGDGRISRAEMAAAASVGGNRGGHDPERRFDAMDSNHDGYLDKDEIRVALEQRFHRMDLNGDGILTPDERMAGRAHRDQSGAASMSPAAQP